MKHWKTIAQKANKPSLSHLLDFTTLNESGIRYLLQRAHFFKSLLITNSPIPQLKHNTKMANLFYEPSTRTQYSFEIAARNLGICVISPNMSGLSDQKGESLLDTFFSLEAMGINLFVVRHAMNNTPHFIANELQTKTKVINAGDGTAHHPTQALIDLFTIYEQLSRFSGLNVAIIGDIAHSRVAKSLMIGLSLLGKNNIVLIAPTQLIPEDQSKLSDIKITSSLDEGIINADVIVCLRIQKERMNKDELPSDSVFFSHYALTKEKLALANSSAIILHPGPINRGIEIESAVADGPQSKILNQVANGIPVRMAILELLLTD